MHTIGKWVIDRFYLHTDKKRSEKKPKRGCGADKTGFSTKTIPTVTTDELIARYDALLLDAYGVLVNKEGALPGAVELIAKLNRLDKPYYLVSNTSAHLPEQASARYRTFGLDLAPERMLTAGLLIKPHFEAQGYQGLRCAVLGPEDSFSYVEGAGAGAVTPFEEFDLVLIGDQVDTDIRGRPGWG